MKKLQEQIWAKTLAFILFCLAAPLCALCAWGAVMARENPEYVRTVWGSAALYNARDWYLPGCLVLAALALAFFVFLMAAAGRREGGLRLRGLDRWPLDILAALCVLACVAVCRVAEELTGGYGPSRSDVAGLLAAAGVVGALLCAICLTLCMSCSARFKSGGWWRNTAVYAVCRFLWRMISGFFRALPLTWKAVLSYCVFTLGNVLAAASREGGWILVFLLIDLAALYAVIRVTLQLRALKKAGRALADGDLSYHADTSQFWLELREHGEDLNSAGLGLSKAVNERMRSERMKTELITNVSHDLKTPLTSIVSYVDLLRKENIDDETARGYIDVLDRQSARLKKLTEDLVEASKASSGALTVNRERLDLGELLRQSVGEYAERFAAADIAPVVSCPEGEVAVTADGRLLWRVLDNLLLNVSKYALPGTRAYIDLTLCGGKAEVVIKNISRESLNIGADELMERFVRGDSSRSTEGSGLGLSIARSLTELMGGAFALTLDGDLFKVALTFDAA